MIERHKLILGVSGLVCAGKSTFARFLRRIDPGVQDFGFRRFFEALMVAKDINVGRKQLDNFAEEYRRAHGSEEVFQRMFTPRASGGLIVADGIRTPGALKWFSARPGYSYIGLYIDASLASRRERLAMRLEEMKTSELLEYDLRLRQCGLDIVRQSADYEFQNDGSLDDLYVSAQRLMVDISAARSGVLR